jgi:hypothetical protein
MLGFLKRNAGNIARTIVSPGAQVIHHFTRGKAPQPKPNNQPGRGFASIPPSVGQRFTRAANSARQAQAPQASLFGGAPVFSGPPSGGGVPQFVFNMPQVPIPPRQDYSAQLAALTAREIAELDNRAIQARENFGILEQDARATKARLNSQNARNVGSLRRNFRQMEDTTTRRLGSAGQLTNPFVAGRTLSQLAQQQQQAISGARSELSDRLSELNTTLSGARRKRDSELSAIRRMRRTLQGDSNRLISGRSI